MSLSFIYCTHWYILYQILTEFLQQLSLNFSRWYYHTSLSGPRTLYSLQDPYPSIKVQKSKWMLVNAKKKKIEYSLNCKTIHPIYLWWNSFSPVDLVHYLGLFSIKRDTQRTLIINSNALRTKHVSDLSQDSFKSLANKVLLYIYLERLL